MPADTNAEIHWQSEMERVLSWAWGYSVTTTIGESFREGGRSRVYRVQVDNGPVKTLLAKLHCGDEQQPYRQGDDTANTPFWRFCNEWAGCRLLGELGFGPRAITCAPEIGLYLMEDLGPIASLADALTGSDPADARIALVAYARSLGAMHAATQDKIARFMTLRRTVGGHEPTAPKADPQAAKALRRLCKRLDVPRAAGLDTELKRIAAAMASPGSYQIITPSDCCPDNHQRRGERVVFFDFEWAGPRHALLDTAYLLAPFCSCWCLSRLPADLPDTLVAAYREHFPGDDRFDELLTLALAHWVLLTLSWDWTGDWLADDHTWGLATLRQRHLYRLENLLARPNLPTVLPALAETAARLHDTLKRLWPDLAPLPLYPAFLGEG